jgi:hypothetical protein
MAQMVEELKIGEVYRISHAKKGTFVGQLIDIVDSDGDEHDKIEGEDWLRKVKVKEEAKPKQRKSYPKKKKKSFFDKVLKR